MFSFLIQNISNMEGWERVQLVMTETGHNKNSFSKIIGLKNNVTITRIINEKRNPSRSTVEKIITRFPRYNFEWLYRGRGEIYNNYPLAVDDLPVLKEPNARQLSPVGRESKLYLETVTGTKYFELANGHYKMRVPLVPYNGYAKYASDVANDVPMENRDLKDADFIVNRLTEGNYMSFEINGDSMDDETKHSLSHGDKVLAKQVDKMYWHAGLHFKRFRFWVVVTDTSVWIKEIVAQNPETGEITLHSLNTSPEYTDFDFNLNDARQIFYIVQKVSAPIVY